MEETISAFDRQQTFILELPYQTVEIMAKALHILIYSLDDQHEAEKALKELVSQTTAAHQNPNVHGVYLDPLKSPKMAKVFKPHVFYLS